MKNDHFDDILNGKQEGSDELPTWKTIQKPVAYVQQIIMKSMVYPYKKDEVMKKVVDLIQQRKFEN